MYYILIYFCVHVKILKRINNASITPRVIFEIVFILLKKEYYCYYVQ